MNAAERKEWVLAVDGGGSKISVVAHLCERDAAPPHSLECARVWTFAHSGSAHPSNWNAAQQHLAEALAIVCHALTLSEAGCPVRHVLFALAGAGREADRRRVLDWARTLPAPFDCASISCVSDIEPLIDYRHGGPLQIGSESRAKSERLSDTAHRGSSNRLSPDLVPTASVAVILGTGSMVATRDQNNEVIRAGGWGPQLGDECSGGALGVAALRSVCEWLDTGSSVERASQLVRAVLSALPERELWSIGPSKESHAIEIALPADLKVDRQKLSSLLIEMAANRGSAATLAHVVLELALQRRDVDARLLLDVHLDRLSWQIEQVVRRAGLSRFELVFSGGVASHYASLREGVTEACRSRGLSPRESVVAEPLFAALRLAFAAAGQH